MELSEAGKRDEYIAAVPIIFHIAVVKTMTSLTALLSSETLPTVRLPTLCVRSWVLLCVLCNLLHLMRYFSHITSAGLLNLQKIDKM